MKKSITAGCLVFKIFEGELKVLLVRSFGKNYWECPKGHNEFGESLRETAIRETFEESGFKASIIKQLKPIFIPREDAIKAIVLYTAYCLNPDNPSEMDGEMAEARFFSTENLPELDAWQKNTIYDAILEMMKEISAN